MHSDVALSPVTREATGGVDVSPAVGSVQAFTARLYGLLATERGNLVCSPYSVAVALAMTRNGARGRTAEEMDAVLQGPSAERLDAAMNALAQRLEDRAGTLDVACSLWGQRDLRWEEPFLDALARHYGAGMRLVDYRSDPDGAARQISTWTTDATHGKIPELIPAGVLDEMTRLVLVNAVYFKGTWAERFD
ncbi:MAG: serpin family protein, partial [Nocardioidaceae bacterium]